MCGKAWHGTSMKIQLYDDSYACMLLKKHDKNGTKKTDDKKFISSYKTLGKRMKMYPMSHVKLLFNASRHCGTLRQFLNNIVSAI